MKKLFIYLFVFFVLPNVAYANSDFPIIKFFKMAITILIIVYIYLFNSTLLAITFIILGLFTLFWNFLLGLDKKNSQIQSLSSAFFGLGLIFVGFTILYAISNKGDIFVDSVDLKIIDKWVK